MIVGDMDVLGSSGTDDAQWEEIIYNLRNDVRKNCHCTKYN